MYGALDKNRLTKWSKNFSNIWFMTDSADLLTEEHEKNLNLELRGQQIRSLDLTIFGR
jgi:hypothetical protein